MSGGSESCLAHQVEVHRRGQEQGKVLGELQSLGRYCHKVLAQDRSGIGCEEADRTANPCHEEGTKLLDGHAFVGMGSVASHAEDSDGWKADASSMISLAVGHRDSFD